MEQSKVSLTADLGLKSVDSQAVALAVRDIVFSPSGRYFAVHLFSTKAFGPGFRTSVYESRTMKRISRHKSVSKLVAFQYDTGLVAMVPLTQDNKVTIWDFKYQRHVREIDFVQPIVQLGYLRNLIIVASTQRLVMNDLSVGQNTVYLPLVNGELVFFSAFYERLHVGYFSNQSVFVNLSLWDGQKVQLEEISFTRGRFDYLGETMMLFGADGVMVYRQRCLTNRIKYEPEEFVECLFDSTGLKPSTGLILVLNRSDNIVVEWYPIYRLGKEDQKRPIVHYSLKYEQILEDDEDLSENTLVYLRDSNLHVSKLGSSCQVYGRHEQFE